MTTTETTETATPEIRHVVYRLFKFNDERTDQTWNEVGKLAGEGPYGYYPTAQEIGEQYGAGHYFYFEDGKGYAAVRHLHIVGETVYREQTEPES